MSYVINIGHERPMEAIVSHPKKDGTPMGSDHLVRRIPVGRHMLANVCSVWGRRVVDGKEFVVENGNKKTIEFNTNSYTGEIEFLDYGDPKGYAITIRYLKQSRSLDVEYQDNVQKIKIDLSKGADGSAQLELESGQNKFDSKKDALLIKYLQVHPQNRDSKSKNPNPEIKGFGFYEITEDNVNTRSIKSIEDSVDAVLIVKNISNNPADLKVILKLIGNRSELDGIDELSKDKQIYEGLLKFANSNSSDFTSLLNEWKRKISEAFEKAKGFKALDLTKDGHISVEINGKTHLVWSEIKAKGDGMIDWVMANYLNSENYKQTTTFIDLVEKLK